MAATCLVLAYAGIVTLGYARGPRWLRWLGRALGVAVALGLTALALGLYWIGEDQGWTGEGPAMLVVMIGLAGAAVCALSAWVAVSVQLLGWGPRSDASPLAALSMIAVGLGGFGYGVLGYRLEQKPAHDAPVVALRLLDGGDRLLSCDRAGTVKTWELPSGDLEAVRSFSALAEARSVLLTRDGRFAVALYADGARVVPLEDGATAPVSVTGVAHAALLRGDGAVLSLGSEVREVSLAAPTEVRAAHPLPVAVSALASDAQGRAVAALADGSVFAVGRGADATRALVRLPAAAERLVASPGGTWLVAMGADRKTWVVDTRSREVRPLEDSWRIEDAAFVRDDALVFHRRDDPSAFRLSLAHLQIEPWFGQGRFLNALEAAPGVSEAAVAQSGDVLLIPSPISGNAYTSESTRLVHRRFRGAR